MCLHIVSTILNVSMSCGKVGLGGNVTKAFHMQVGEHLKDRRKKSMICFEHFFTFDTVQSLEGGASSMSSIWNSIIPANFILCRKANFVERRAYQKASVMSSLQDDGRNYIFKMDEDFWTRMLRFPQYSIASPRHQQVHCGNWYRLFILRHF